MTPTSPFALRASLAAAALAGIALLSSCGAEPRGAPAPAPITDIQRHALHVGLDDGGPDQGALGRVVAARVTEGARHVVVLDFVAPYVKVFDATGRFQNAFMSRGGGPGEARGPSALAVAGDSAVLVADGARSLTVFGLDGRVRAQRRIPGFFALAAVAACPDEWLLYGPRVNNARDTRVTTWLHQVRFVGADSVEVRSALEDSLPPRLSAGLPYGLVADAGGAVVRHTLTGRPRVVRLACGGGAPRVLHQGEPPAKDPEPRRENGRLLTSVTPGMRAPGGMAALGRGVIFGEKVQLGKGHTRLDLTLVADGREETLSIAGDYVLHDSRPDVGVLLSTADPVPQVFLVRTKDFLGMFPSR